jgi:hypothetical protein
MVLLEFTLSKAEHRRITRSLNTNPLHWRAHQHLANVCVPTQDNGSDVKPVHFATQEARDKFLRDQKDPRIQKRMRKIQECAIRWIL